MTDESHNNAAQDKPRFLRIGEVIFRTGLSRSTLYDEITKGKFPKNFPLSKRTVGWLEAEIDAWIANRLNEGGRRHN